MGLVVEADGPVRQAFWQDYTPNDYSNHLSVGMFRIAPGKSSWAAVEMRNGYSYRDAALAGDDELLRPPVLFDRLQTDNAATAFVGSHYYLEMSHNLRVRKWDGTDLGLLPVGTGITGGISWVGPTLLYVVSVFPQYYIRRWTEQDGDRVLMGFGADHSRGVADAGSDGVDLVWIQGEDGFVDGTPMFNNAWIMASKFSTDPSEIKPRRLTRWVSGLLSGGQVPPVGCGYAAFHYAIGWPKLTESGMLVVRLSDGMSWKVPDGPFPQGWIKPIAITCDEVFARFKGSYYETIRRVRLDSLGPGIPASVE
jgi:hypothetical protein